MTTETDFVNMGMPAALATELSKALGSGGGTALGYYDVVVYGSTIAGVAAAIAAIREGASVAIFEPRNRKPGGMLSGGIAYQDMGGGAGQQSTNTSFTAVGLGREIFEECVAEYRQVFQAQWNINLTIEPKVWDAVIGRLLKRYNIPVFNNAKILSAANVTMVPATYPGTTGNTTNLIQSVTFDTQGTVSAKVFIDCMYEGDLVQFSGVPYNIGREATGTYSESYAGLIDTGNTFGAIDPYVTPGTPASGLLPGIQTTTFTAGVADPNIQAMGYRFEIANDAGNKNGVAFSAIPAPPNYNPLNYELLGRYAQANPGSFTSITSLFLTQIPLVSNDGWTNKRDVNTTTPFSTDLVDGGALTYITGGWPNRYAYDQALYYYTMGLFYFITHDSRMTALTAFQTSLATYQFCNDEFLDSANFAPYQYTKNFPPYPYVREGPRILGDNLDPAGVAIWGRAQTQLKQSDLQTPNSAFTDAIAFCFYFFDMHVSQRLVVSGAVVNEGVLTSSQATTIYITAPLPARMLIPQQAYCSNLLVPICHAASHVAWACTRLEMNYMHMGHAAGVMAAMIAERGCAAGQIINNVPLQNEFKRRYDCYNHNQIGDGGFLASDGTLPVGSSRTQGTVTLGTGWTANAVAFANGPSGNATSIAASTTSGSTLTYTPNILRSGMYSVYTSWNDSGAVSLPNRASASQYVLTVNGTAVMTTTVNQNINGDGGNDFYLGDFFLPKGTTTTLVVTADASGLSTSSSNMKWKPALRYSRFPIGKY